MAKFIDLTGATFGRLTVIEKARPYYDNQGTRWVVKCQCGTVKELRHSTLRSGRVVSCGCRERETQQLFKEKYGTPKPKAERVERQSGVPEAKPEPRTPDRIYDRWTWIRWHAKEKGITFYAAWLDFDTFVSDVGRPPHEDYCLVRQDKKQGWFPGNVIWQEGRKKTCNGQASNKLGVPVYPAWFKSEAK